MDGVICTPIKKIKNPKGDIFHALKKSDKGFKEFGEAYFSFINQYDIKGWKKHNKMTLNLIVPIGAIEFVIYNDYLNQYFSTVISSTNYKRITVEPGLWVAFRGIHKNNMLLNIASIEHNQNESVSKELNEIKFEW